MALLPPEIRSRTVVERREHDVVLIGVPFVPLGFKMPMTVRFGLPNFTDSPMRSAALVFSQQVLRDGHADHRDLGVGVVVLLRELGARRHLEVAYVNNTSFVPERARRVLAPL